MKSEVLGVDVGLLTAAHELKSPLSLLRQLALSLDLVDDPRELTSQMVQISDRALAQIDDLLKVARLENGLFELEPLNPRNVCDSLFTQTFHAERSAGSNFASPLLRPHFSAGQNSAKSPTSGVKLIYRNRSPLVIANRTLLRSILANFLENARKYGNITHLSVCDHRQNVRISVRDHGPALPTDVWRAINQGTVDSPLPTPLRPGSSGLGLFISTRFAAHMRAPISATRHRDGTSFHLDLPVSRQLTLC